MKNYTKLLLTCWMVMLSLALQAAQRSDTFTTKTGKTVTITHIKHASLQIDYDGRVFYFDPVGQGVKPVTDFSTYPHAHFIFVTHEHFDHYDNLAINQLLTPATVIYTNQSVRGKLHQGLALSNGDSVRVAKDICVWAVPAYNTTPGREQYHPKGRDNGFVLELDGLRIYIAGDTENIPEMSQLGHIDIAFLPCNQPYTMTVDQLIAAAQVIKPRVLFPYHYGETSINQVLMRLMGSGIDVRIRDYK